MAMNLETANLLFENRALLIANSSYGEADTISHLVDPVLNFLGYPATHQLKENRISNNRPDIVLWNMPAALRGTAPARAILEAKPLGFDLEGKGRPRAARPKNQIKRYVMGHPHSQSGTYGILTDGNVWHLIQNSGGEREVRLVQEWRLLDGTKEQAAVYLREIDEILNEPSPPSSTAPERRAHRNARQICQAMADGETTAEVLRLFTHTNEHKTNLAGEANLQGRSAAAEAGHWQEYAYANAGRLKAEQLDLAHESAAVAVIRAADAETSDDAVLNRDDTAIAAKTFAQTVPTKTSVTLMFQPDEDGAVASARLAVHYRGHTGMTTEFSPCTPSPIALKAIQKIHDLLNRKTPVMARTLADVVAAKGVREEFYGKIATGWTLRQQRKATGDDRRRHAYREAVLRHLIRTIFAWILKEEGELPPEAFDRAFADREAATEYHDGILTFLFRQRLNKPSAERPQHPNSNIDQALSGTRFLNGSLFERHPDDDLLHLTHDDYFGIDPDEPGLFTILGEYDWTASEHTPHSSDQTIDPEVLSNLFENLIAATRFGEEVPDRMPSGTYYTPADVALEMVKDALTEAVADYAPATWTKADLRTVFGGEDTSPPDTSEAVRKHLVERIRDLRIYDPAVGSGEFPLTVTVAIRTALQKLGVSDDNASVTRDIIARQLFAQDINAMAVQVTRLRLFIAVIANEDPGLASRPPLPNLEGRIVCADTLATIADPSWRPDRADSFADEDRNVREALLNRARVIQKWSNAHTEPAKAEVRAEDMVARAALQQAISGKPLLSHMDGFAKMALLEPDPQPVQADPRLLFYDPDWEGFDVAIGNPPYERFSKTDRGRTSEQLKQQGYMTTPGNDLYNLISEAALSLVNPDGGVVTLVVPLSLSFGQDQADTRRLFEKRSSSVWIRHQDNGPDTTFHDSPVSNPKNRQRTTIITAVMGPEAPGIYTTCTNKWRRSEREQYLLDRRYARLISNHRHAKLARQWARIPSDEIAEMILAMNRQRNSIGSLAPTGDEKAMVAYPPTAYQFITVTPSGMLVRNENGIPVPDQACLELAVAALNGHAAYAWWRVYGDAFHVNPHELFTVAIPDTWLDDAHVHRTARQLGRNLIDAVGPSNIESLKTGTKGKVQDSLNFHKCAASTISEIDALYLAALGLEGAPLIGQLHAIRSDSTWRM